MRRLATFLATWALAGPAPAALQEVQPAPDFTAPASLGGQVFSYSLQQALKTGPVVLYFYPAAFTPGCTIEAHDFAEAVDKYKALGATVIGVSRDDIEKLKRFSVSECRGKFPVAADGDGHITKAYDAALALVPGYASRTSYVISPAGRIVYAYKDMSPDRHVANTLEALRRWRAEAK